MQASMVVADPVFRQKVSPLKNTLDGLPAEIIIDSKVITMAKTEIILDTRNPDFSAIAGRIALMTDVVAEETSAEGDVKRTVCAIAQLFENGYNLISSFFSVEKFGLPSMGLWTWIIRCLVEDSLPQPQLGSPQLIIDHDPESILLQAKLQYLERELKKGRTDNQNILDEIDNLEGQIAAALPDEVRILAEIRPGENLKEVLTQLPSTIKRVSSDMGTDLFSYKIPADFAHKVQRIVIPRQFQGYTLEDISQAENREKSNISRDYNQIIDKTGYQPILPKPRGPNRI